MDLKCKKLNCKYNNACACMSKGIIIKRSCECGTFEQDCVRDEKQHQDISKNMFEVAPEIHPFRHNKNVSIECKAECLFNNDGVCKANGISVMNGKNSGVCITNIEPWKNPLFKRDFFSLFCFEIKPELILVSLKLIQSIPQHKLVQPLLKLVLHIQFLLLSKLCYLSKV